MSAFFTRTNHPLSNEKVTHMDDRSHCGKVQKYNRAKQVSNYVVLIMQQNIMKKELKSCKGVLLRADLTGHGHRTLFDRKGLDGHALLGQPSKGHRAGFLFFFHNVLLHSWHHLSKNWRPIFTCSYFTTFAQCSSVRQQCLNFHK